MSMDTKRLDTIEVDPQHTGKGDKLVMQLWEFAKNAKKLTINIADYTSLLGCSEKIGELVDESDAVDYVSGVPIYVSKDAQTGYCLVEPKVADIPQQSLNDLPIASIDPLDRTMCQLWMAAGKASKLTINIADYHSMMAASHNARNLSECAATTSVNATAPHHFANIRGVPIFVSKDVKHGHYVAEPKPMTPSDQPTQRTLDSIPIQSHQSFATGGDLLLLRLWNVAESADKITMSLSDYPTLNSRSPGKWEHIVFETDGSFINTGIVAHINGVPVVADSSVKAGHYVAEPKVDHNSTAHDDGSVYQRGASVSRVKEAIGLKKDKMLAIDYQKVSDEVRNLTGRSILRATDEEIRAAAKAVGLYVEPMNRKDNSLRIKQLIDKMVLKELVENNPSKIAAQTEAMRAWNDSQFATMESVVDRARDIKQETPPPPMNRQNNPTIKLNKTQAAELLIQYQAAYEALDRHIDTEGYRKTLNTDPSLLELRRRYSMLLNGKMALETFIKDRLSAGTMIWSPDYPSSKVGLMEFLRIDYPNNPVKEKPEKQAMSNGIVSITKAEAIKLLAEYEAAYKLVGEVSSKLNDEPIRTAYNMLTDGRNSLSDFIASDQASISWSASYPHTQKGMEQFLNDINITATPTTKAPPMRDIHASYPKPTLGDIIHASYPKPTLGDILKDNLASAGYRVAATQSTTLIKNSIVSLMRSKGATNEHIQGLVSFLETEWGMALISGGLGIGLNYLPKYGDDPRVQRLAEEMRISGMAIVGNEIVGEAIQHVLPALTSILDKLPAVEDKQLAEKTHTIEDHIQEEVAEHQEVETQLQAKRNAR